MQRGKQPRKTRARTQTQHDDDDDDDYNLQLSSANDLHINENGINYANNV